MITLDVPNDDHLKIKQIQLDKEGKGEKVTLKEVYYLVIKEGLEALKTKNPGK